MTLPELSRPPLSQGEAFFAVELEPATGELVLLDQRILPTEIRYLRLRTIDEIATAIRTMVVRGAPAIGITAAYGLALLGARERGAAASFLMAIGVAGRALGATRPTAVNLAWAIARLGRRAAGVAALAPDERGRALIEEAEAIHREDVAACRAMGELGACDVPEGATVITHCNAGALATGGYGTALGVIRAAHAKGRVRMVLACETRPYLQGARLTAWELARDGIPVEVITDSMAGHFLQRGEISFAVVGADRIAANGDVANKIGTYGLAVLCRAHDVPFTVAAPWSTVDLRTEGGAAIPIEQRSRDEVAKLGSTTLVADGIACRHPAFDVTPARYVHALYTELGRARLSIGENVESLAARRREALSVDALHDDASSARVDGDQIP
jgi:methylthioribose-1-phosphate isomerase